MTTELTQLGDHQVVSLTDVAKTEHIPIDLETALSQDEKIELAHNKESFFIVDAEQRPSEEGFNQSENATGFYWVFSIVLTDRPEGEQQRLIFMGENLKNALLYAAIHKYAVEQKMAVGPLQLELIEWKGGNPFYKLQPVL